MFRKKEKQVEVEIDYTDIQKGIRNAKIWMIFNAVLFVGGMMTMLDPKIAFIALGVLIFCPISVIKNFRKYLKFKKYSKNYTNEFPEEDHTKKDESVDEWFNKSADFVKLEKWHESLACCDKALEIDPHHEGSWISKGVALGQLGYHEDAIKCFDKALEINPDNSNMWTQKGVILGEVKKLEESIVCYDKALEINPNDKTAWSSKGMTLGMLDRFKESIECFDKVLEIDPEDASAVSNRDLVLAKLPQDKEEIMEKNLEKDSENEPIKILKVRFAKGEISKEEYEEMKESLKD